MQANATRKLFLLFCTTCLLAVSGCDYFASPSTRLERARQYVAEGDRRAALVELKNALQKQPDLHEGRLLLADIALWLGDPTSAEDEVRRLPPAVQPAEVEDLKARIDLALGRHEQLLQRLERPDGMMPAVRRDMYRGLALLQQRKSLTEAESLLRKAIAADASLVPAQAALVEVLSVQGESSQALELSERLAREHSESAEIWLARGMLLARSDTSAAIEALERARVLAPKQLDAVRHSLLLAALVDLHLASGQIDAAKASSEQLQRLSPRSSLATLTSSRVQMAANDYVSAATDLRRLVNAAPKFVQARYMLGVALAAQGNLEQASQELAQVVDQAPEFAEARQLLAQVKLRLNDPDGALQAVVPGLQGEGSSLQLASLIDAARVQTGGSWQAFAALERELAKDPQNTAIETELAVAYLQSGNAPKTLALLRKSTTASRDPRREALLLQAILEVEGPQAARSRLDTLLASRPIDPKLTALGAAFLARLGDAEAGRRVLKEKIAAGPDAQELYFALAQLEWAARQPVAAREALEKLLVANPNHSQARLALAEIELATGNRREGKAHLEEVRKQDPRSSRARLLLANLALSDDDAAQAGVLVDEALKASENKAELRANAGFMYLNAGRYDQAIQHLQEGVKIDSRRPPMWLLLGRAQLAVNQHGAARQSFEQALKLRPQWIAAEGALVFLDIQLKAIDPALQRLAALRQALPQDAAVAALEGQVFFALRRYADAAAAFDRAAQLEPSGALAANSYEARLAGKLPNPTAPLENWIEKHPEDTRYRLMLAEAHTQAGERRKAVQHYEVVVLRQPQNVRALNNLAWLYYDLKDARAVEFARRASALAPDSPAVSDTLGWILVETGETAQGLPILERAAAKATGEPEIGFHYAVALLRAGQVDKGTAYLRRLLKEHASFPSRSEAERLAGEASAGV